MEVELPELPDPKVDPDDGDWLFSSDRNYLEQLNFYKKLFRKRGRTMNFKRKFELAGENPFITWRKEQGLTRAELARLLDVPYNTVYSLEHGHFSVPLPERLVYKIYKAGLPYELLAEYARWRRAEPKEGTAVH